jgi:hypothetical protein
MAVSSEPKLSTAAIAKQCTNNQPVSHKADTGLFTMQTRQRSVHHKADNSARKCPQYKKLPFIQLVAQ